MSQYDEDPWVRPDWAKWQGAKQGKLWHAVALACNYDPINFKFLDYKELSNYHGAHPRDFVELLTLAKSNLGGKLKAISINKSSLQESEVLFSVFRSWLKSTGYETPPEYPRALNEEQSLTGETPLGERERATLLTLIAALSHEVGIDITKPSKAAGLIEGLTLRIERRIAARTIEEHLKRIPAALEKRSP